MDPPVKLSELVQAVPGKPRIHIRDDAPILGYGPAGGLVYATGHHRNGILLAPITADAIARLVLDGTMDPVIAPFGLDRFAPAPARAAE